MDEAKRIVVKNKPRLLMYIWSRTIQVPMQTTSRQHVYSPVSVIVRAITVSIGLTGL